MKTIKGINELKKEYRKAKIMCGDFRGIKNRFEFNGEINPMQTLFYSFGGSSGKHGQDVGKIELITEVFENENSNGWTEYNLADFIKNIKTYTQPVRVESICNEWNKKGTERDTRTLFEIEYIN